MTFLSYSIFLGLPIFILQISNQVAQAQLEIPPPAAAVFIFEDTGSNNTGNVEDFSKTVVKGGSPDSSSPEPHRILLNDIVNTDVEVAAGRKIELECLASLPVQWSYRGPGKPEFMTSVAVSTKNNREVFKATLVIPHAHEKDSGMYACIFPEFPRIASTYHIFVPGDNIFVSDSGRTITYANGDKTVTIPCQVSVKNSKVTLRKVSYDNSLRILESPIAIFDPRSGFKLSVKDLRDADGTYICSGYHQGSLRAREYTLRNEERNQSSVTFPDNLQEDINPCLSYRCPRSSVCRVNLNTNLPFCACGPKASSSVTNCTRLCKSTRDCPKTEKCDFNVEKQLKMCVHVCQDHTCAENGECYVEEQRGAPKCRCRRGFQGDGDNLCERIPLQSDEVSGSSYCSAAKCGPHARCVNIGGKVRCACYVGYFGSWPHCEKACVHDNDCDVLDRCSPTKGVCEHVCTENMCAPKAECKVLRRSPLCICPPGFTGNAKEACYQSHFYHYSSRSGLPAAAGNETDLQEPEATTTRLGDNGEILQGNVNESLTLSFSDEESNTQSSSLKYKPS